MILVKLEGIPGDYVGKGKDIGGKALPKQCFAAGSISWAIEREMQESGKGGTGDINLGTPNIEPIEITKSMDTASSKLMIEAIGGKSLGDGFIYFLESLGAEDEPVTYLQFKLHRAIVAAWNISGSDDDRPEETVKVEYAKVSMQYAPYDSTSNVLKPGDVWGWDRMANSKWAG